MIFADCVLYVCGNPKRPEEAVRVPVAGDTDDYEAQDINSELDWGTLEYQEVLIEFIFVCH